MSAAFNRNLNRVVGFVTTSYFIPPSTDSDRRRPFFRERLFLGQKRRSKFDEDPINLAFPVLPPPVQK